MATNPVNKRDTVSIKGTKNGLVILLDLNYDFNEVKNRLKMKMESSNGFFSGATYMFHTGQQKLAPHQLHELDAICTNYGLAPNAEPYSFEIEKLFQAMPSKPKKRTAPPGEKALLIKRTLRSGQHITHPSHIIILGNVHPGAKVEAGGNILVMGTCSGTVHAGTSGDSKASITAIRLNPQVIRIADLIYSGTIHKTITTGPQKAFIYDNNIILEQTD